MDKLERSTLSKDDVEPKKYNTKCTSIKEYMDLHGA